MTYKTFTLADLRALLAPLNNTRRQVIFYTLETQGAIDGTVMLGWKEGLRTQAPASPAKSCKRNHATCGSTTCFGSISKMGPLRRSSDLKTMCGR